MKAIKFFVTTLLVAMMSMLMVSCEGGEKPTNNNSGGNSGPTITASIVGNWELKEVIRTNNEGAVLDKNDKIEGEYWDFSLDILTVGGVEYDYTFANAKLTTDYAKIYKADFFSVQELTETDLKISASYLEEDKVGDRKITNTLKFRRLAE